MAHVTHDLDRLHDTPEPRVAVLFLHGGQESSRAPVRRRHASWWRVAAMGRRLGDLGEARAVTYLVRYAVRGWNDPTDPSPVRDATAALAELRELHPGLPVVLVGHSMGGRTACRVAHTPGVAGVVALAPWLPEHEPVETVRDRHLRIIHGTGDRWTSPRFSRDYARRATDVAASVTWDDLPGVGHFMFRRVEAWNAFVEESVSEILALHEAADQH